MCNFSVGDRYYVPNYGKYLTLESYDKNADAWKANWNTAGFTRIYPEELIRLKFFSSDLIKIKNDKHLLELRLRYV